MGKKVLTAHALSVRIQQSPFEKLNKIVYDLIEEAIISRELTPGSKINMVQIAQTLGISRTPVKEAMELIHKNGLVVSNDQTNGYYVFQVSSSYLDQLFVARRSIEGAATYLCAQHNNLIDLDQLERLAQRFKDTYEEQQFEEFLNADAAFHRLLVTSCRNNFLIDMYDKLEKDTRYYWIRTKEYLERVGATPFSGFGLVVNQHHAIYNAVKLGIPELAESVMRSHLDMVHNASYAISPPK